MQKTYLAACLLAIWLPAQTLIPGQALAWGDTGHRTIGTEAMRALPRTLPAFLRSAYAISSVGEYSREPDLWRGSGVIHDADRDPAHFIALDDDGKTLAGLSLDALPATRAQFEIALHAKGIDPAKAGDLPYSTSDAYEQVIKDMAYWRVITLGITREKNAANRTWLKAALARREALVLRDIGVLSHYVGDATQPMHLSIHSNGWGDYPNPEGFTREGIHWPLEGAYVRTHVVISEVQKQMAPYSPCTDTVETCIRQRLMRNSTQLLPLYRLEKDGGFRGNDPRGAIYLAGLMARGASDLRDMLTDGWRDSVHIGVGHSQISFETLSNDPSADITALMYGES